MTDNSTGRETNEPSPPNDAEATGGETNEPSPPNDAESVAGHTDGSGHPDRDAVAPGRDSDVHPLGGGTDSDGPETAAGDQPPRYHPPAQETFDWRGWLLVGVVVVSFLVVPAMILYLPYAQDLIAAVGVSWRQAYLTLPMIPAILLGATAIWAAVMSRSKSE